MYNEMKNPNKYKHVVVGCMPIISVVRVQEIRIPYDKQDMPCTTHIIRNYIFHLWRLPK